MCVLRAELDERHVMPPSYWCVLDLLSWVHTQSEAAMKAGRVVEGMCCGGGGGVWGGLGVLM